MPASLSCLAEIGQLREGIATAHVVDPGPALVIRRCQQIVVFIVLACVNPGALLEAARQIEGSRHWVPEIDPDAPVVEPDEHHFPIPTGSNALWLPVDIWTRTVTAARFDEGVDCEGRVPRKDEPAITGDFKVVGAAENR